MDKNVSLDVTSTKLCQAFDIDKLLIGLEAYRKDVVFKEFIYRSPASDGRSEQDCINGLLLLFTKARHV